MTRNEYYRILRSARSERSETIRSFFAGLLRSSSHPATQQG